MPLPVSILRASLLRSGSTGLGLRPPPATITTRRWSSQYHRARIALSRPSGCAQCQIRRFYSNGSGSGGNGGNKDANVDAKTREDQRKKEEEERVIYYQPPPEGYEQQQPQHAGRQTDTADANAPQQHEAERPKEAGVEGLDPTTVGIGSTHGGANGIGKDGNTQAEGGLTEHDINLRTDGEEKESRRDTAAYTGYDRSALADQLATGINTNTGTDTGPNANESTAKSTPSSPGSDDGTGPHPGRLPSELQQRRSELTKKFEKMMDNMQSNIFMAGQTLNDLTGYSEIERLKQEIIKQEEAVRAARRRVRDCKEAYSDAIHKRSASQREVNELLQRKHAWSPIDVERFTSLYRSDHANERAEAKAQEDLGNAERESEEASTTLSRSILARYHEEQIWSDKIRRMSTWGTWGLMGVNVLLFLVLQIAVEPWRRKRLVRGFEEKVFEALEKERDYTEMREKEKSEEVGPVMAAANAAIEAVREAARDMRGAMNAGTVGEEADAALDDEEKLVWEGDAEKEAPEEPTEPAPEEVLVAEDAPEGAATVTPTDPISALDEEALQAQFHKFIARVLVKLPPSISQRFVEHFRNDTTVSMSPRDLSTIALESAAAGAALTGVVGSLLVLVLRGQ